MGSDQYIEAYGLDSEEKRVKFYEGARLLQERKQKRKSHNFSYEINAYETPSQIPSIRPRKLNFDSEDSTSLNFSMFTPVKETDLSISKQQIEQMEKSVN